MRSVDRSIEKIKQQMIVYINSYLNNNCKLLLNVNHSSKNVKNK